jgi:hypothetical protein
VWRVTAASARPGTRFAAWSIRAGVQLFYLSLIMGASVQMLDERYGHLVPDSEEFLRGLLDTYDNATEEAQESCGNRTDA